MRKTFKYTLILFALLILSLEAFSQTQKVYMDEYNLPFAWELPINDKSDYGVVNRKIGKYRIGVRDHFLTKITVGENITANYYNGDLAKRIRSTKEKLKTQEWQRFEVTFMDDTENSFIRRNRDLRDGQTAYVFYGFLTNNGTEYDFETPANHGSTYNDCKELSKAFETIAFTSSRKKVKLLTKYSTTEIEEGDTLNLSTLVEEGITSRLYNNEAFEKYDVLRIGVYVLAEKDNNKTNEAIFISSEPILEKQYYLNEDVTFYKNAPMEDVIEGKVETTYLIYSADRFGLKQTVEKLQTPIKVVTILTGYIFESEGQFKPNEDGTIGKVLGGGSFFYIK